MPQRLTKRIVEGLQPTTRILMHWDSELKGFGVKVMPSGQKVLQFVYRFPRGRAGTVRRYKLGDFGQITVEEARRLAEQHRGEVAKGNDPMAKLVADRATAEAIKRAPKKAIAKICEDFIERYAKKHNRRWRETERILKRHIVSAWGRRQIGTITRADVNELLDNIEDNSGGPMANAVLAQLRKMFNWYATRDDTFNSPIVIGMARVKPKSMRRERFLTDDEVRVLWAALSKVDAPFSNLVRFLLLTAQRREEAAQALIGEFKGTTWKIPGERYKTGVGNVVPLSTAAFQQIEAYLDATTPDQFVFTTTGDRPFSGFSKSKRRLDEEMEHILRRTASIEDQRKPTPLLKPWRIHDLRRTAKTLMLRAGVRPDITERVLGHKIAGVEGVYDRHDYVEEKREALIKLSDEVLRIANGDTASNVVPLNRVRKNV